MQPFVIKHPIAAASAIIIGFVLARCLLIPGGLSGFIVAGSEHVDASINPTIQLTEGSGYDGQYFYRYALNPFNTENPFNGIDVDTPAYRHQRAAFPVLVWLFSFGYAPAVPIVMVLLNALFFIGLVAGLKKIFLHTQTQVSSLVVLLVPGLWMSFARNLAEVQEAALFVFLVLAFLHNRKLIFAILATLMVFTREPSAFILASFALAHLTFLFTKARDTFYNTVKWIASATIPCLLFFLFRVYIFHHYSQSGAEGADDFNPIPFFGLIQGFGIQIRKTMQTGATGQIEMAFYIGNIGILVCWLATGLAVIRKGWHLLQAYEKWLWLITVNWLIVIILFSYKIWEDDWGFTRILTIPVIASLIIGRLPKRMLLLSGVFIALTLLRLAVRV